MIKLTTDSSQLTLYVYIRSTKLTSVRSKFNTLLTHPDIKCTNDSSPVTVWVYFLDIKCTSDSSQLTKTASSQLTLFALQLSAERPNTNGALVTLKCAFILLYILY